MKKLLITAFAALALVGCSGIKNNNKDIKVIGDYFVEIKEPVNLIPFTEAGLRIAEHKDWMAGCGCSSCCKVMDNGDLIFSRNMDLSLSLSPAWFYRTECGKYKTINIFYYEHAVPEFADLLKEEHVDKEFLELMPWMCADDIMNEKGFYIEDNMRGNEYNPDGSYISHLCPGTNPGKPRLLMIGLAMYLGSNAATVKEALALLDEVDIYNYINEDCYHWNLSFHMGDATGDYGLIEFFDNKIYYTPKAAYQANYFVTPELETHFGKGYGRTQVYIDGLPSAKNEEDMMKLGEKAFYSTVSKNCHEGTYNVGFDIRSDIVGNFPVNEEGKLDYENGIIYNCPVEWLLDDKNLDQILPELKPQYDAYYEGYTEIEDLRRLDPPRYWSTSYNVTANCMKKTMKVRLWEDTSKVYDFKIK